MVLACAIYAAADVRVDQGTGDGVVEGVMPCAAWNERIYAVFEAERPGNLGKPVARQVRPVTPCKLKRVRPRPPRGKRGNAV